MDTHLSVIADLYWEWDEREGAYLVEERELLRVADWSPSAGKWIAPFPFKASPSR